MADDGVEVFVAGGVGAGAVIGLADPTRAVDEGFVEAALVGLVGILVAEVPLPEDARGVTRGFEDLGKNGGVEGHALALEDGVGYAILQRVPPGHDGRASGRAGGTHEETGEAHAGVIKLVEVGGADPRVAVLPDRPVALVVGHDENDVWGLGRSRGEDKGDQKKEELGEAFHGW